MVWSITDRVIEEPEVLEKEFTDMQQAGFGGVAGFVRCSRYSWDDPEARRALAGISRLCRKRGMSFWFGPDPRFVSHKLIGRTPGITVLLFGDKARADVFPNIAPIVNGKFSIRCEIPPRHVHTLTDVAIDFRPIGILKVFALRREGNVQRVRDITGKAHFFYNARDRYVEAFGSWEVKEPWEVIAFFEVGTNHVDFSDTHQMLRYDAMLRQLKASGCKLDGIMWDEPGFTCTYGSLPVSRKILSGYRTVTGRSIEKDLWKLAIDAADGSHIPVREAYYSSVQKVMTRSQQGFRKAAQRIWGKRTIVGIHDTWHFESADMCDMNHGSLDLWSTVRAKSGGFVDLGAVQQLADRDSPWYRQFAAMTAVCATLGKLSDGNIAYNNLWTVGDDNGDGSQRKAMNHCADVMDLFGIRWLSHAYGPVGTIGQERTFLGSPPLPGYPEHSTWKDFPEWNARLSQGIEAVNGSLPISNILVLFPVETLYALGDMRANRAAEEIFDLILQLLDNQYHVDVISTTSLRSGAWRRGRFHLRRLAYDAIIYPHPGVVDEQLVCALRKGPTHFVFTSPQRTKKGAPVKGSLIHLSDSAALLEELSREPHLRPVRAPQNCWVTMTAIRNGTMVSIAPSRAGGIVTGSVEFGEATISLPNRSGIQRIFFPQEGEPSLL